MLAHGAKALFGFLAFEQGLGLVVGQFVGPEALGSVGSTTILVTLFTGFLIGMGNGVKYRCVGLGAMDLVMKSC